MEKEIMDFNIVQILLCINPIIAFAKFGRKLPAHSRRIELSGVFCPDEMVFVKERLVTVRNNIIQNKPSFETIGRTFAMKRRTSFGSIAVCPANSYSVKCG